MKKQLKDWKPVDTLVKTLSGERSDPSRKSLYMHTSVVLTHGDKILLSDSKDSALKGQTKDIYVARDVTSFIVLLLRTWGRVDDMGIDDISDYLGINMEGFIREKEDSDKTSLHFFLLDEYKDIRTVTNGHRVDVEVRLMKNDKEIVIPLANRASGGKSSTDKEDIAMEVVVQK